MKFIIVTGMSGAGKSTVLRFLEDSGYFCVDNLPPGLIGKFGEISCAVESGFNKVALGVDIRSGDSFEDVFEEIDLLKSQGINMEIIFLESKNLELVRRFKETRRKHPLVGDGRLEDGIKKERQMLEPLKKHATHIIDTTKLLTRELKKELYKVIDSEQSYDNLIITVLSFGFKYGIPADSDLVFDVRFIPNPYYQEDLRALTGNDKAVQEYVMKWDVAKDFVRRLDDMIEFLIPNYIQEGKNQLVISIGCTGGKHRSVTIANALVNKLEASHYSVHGHNRDIQKDALNSK